MAIRIHNFPEKNFGRGNPPLSMSSFNVNYPSWWVSNEHQVPLSLSSNVCSKTDSPLQKGSHEIKNLSFKIVDQDSSSTQSLSISQSGGANSQDQSISSESGQNENCSRNVDGQMKSVFWHTNNTSEGTFNPSRSEHSHQMVHVPYPLPDPYFSGLMTAYGPPAIIQPQTGSQAVGLTPARVPLPLGLPEDGPIYVNAKQYHGIMRRRQSRAKLEAQNKLVKIRKPYLHESRHLHALNRVRGSGGRFLSTKKLQHASSHRDPSRKASHRPPHSERSIPAITCSETNVAACSTFKFPETGKWVSTLSTFQVGSGRAEGPP
ncbi:hypothetical protein SAY87_007034 [Trapa incisa]|uniref:Nuclear transcription factor Y subunit n=1 Tax=Trapa incisa TaxID=236973 RepID=A0AAN7K276_9MYRT|nr:hypothetical protein SAY87_007034 [Trapa incisa]